MENVDAVRGYERTILFSPSGHARGGSLPLTNCVVETIENDYEARSPLLSLRFYHKPIYPYQLTDRSAAEGRPLYDEDTPIGTRMDLGPEMVQSLIEQLQAKLPELLRILNDISDEAGG